MNLRAVRAIYVFEMVRIDRTLLQSIAALLLVISRWPVVKS